MIKNNRLASVGFVFALMVASLPPSATAQMVPMDALEDMDRHWGQLIREQDPVKQKVLIEEHRKKMAAYSDKKFLKKMHQSSSKEMMQTNMDIMNTIKMHKKMMQMLDMM